MGWTAFRNDGSVKESLASATGPQGPAGDTSGLELVYAYTVTGSDKASIDTGVDTAAAGSLDWTNGDLLEVYIQARTDEASVGSFLAMTFNNDTANNYRGVAIFASSASSTVSRSDYAARANLPILVAGASNAANYSGASRVTIPNYTGTTFYKTIDEWDGQQDSTSGNQITLQCFEYLSTAAITRLAITPLTAAKKLKVGTQLLIYKRTRLSPTSGASLFNYLNMR